MKIVVYIVILVGLAGASAWLYTHEVAEERKEVAMQYQRMVAEEKNARDKAEADAKKEAEEKERVVKMLNAYLKQETQSLNKIVEECKIKMEQIALDQKDLSDAILDIERRNDETTEKSRRRNIKRFDKAERVSLLLKNPVINAMAEKYLGEDLTVTYAKYKSEMKTEIDRYNESEKRLRQNRDKYYEEVKDVDDQVEKRSRQARKMNSDVIQSVEVDLKVLQKEKVSVQRELESIVNHPPKEKKGVGYRHNYRRSEMHRRQVEALRSRLSGLESQERLLLNQRKTLKTQSAHMDATEAETFARRKYDTAAAKRADADNDVHKDSAHDVAIFEAAAYYEKQTLDRIRDAMKTIYVAQSSKEADARKKLDYISRSVSNIDLLRADEIERLRKNVVEELSKGLLVDGQKDKKQ